MHGLEERVELRVEVEELAARGGVNGHDGQRARRPRLHHIAAGEAAPLLRGLHSSTFQLNVSRS